LQTGNKKNIILIIVIALLFVIGLIHLFLLRFRTGEVYPPYSSLRSDPLGTRAYFESLSELGDISMERNYRSMSKISSGKHMTFFYIGSDIPQTERIARDDLSPFNRIAGTGGRLVITFLPVTKEPFSWRIEGKSKTEKKKADKNKKKTDDADNEKRRLEQKHRKSKDDKSEGKDKPEPCDPCGKDVGYISFQNAWGINFGFAEDFKKIKTAELVSSEYEEILPKSISWHSIMYFKGIGETWRILYSCNDRPVIIERKLGSGTLILSSDSYFLSNEALRNERMPELLAWLFGPNSIGVFDEFHFGIQETQNVAGLIRKYDFHWFFLGIILIAGLFVWKNALHFVPPYRDEEIALENEIMSGKDSTHGLVSLLRRNIQTRNILKVCWDELEKSRFTDKRITPETVRKLKSVIHMQKDKQQDPTVGYNRIADILKEGKKK